MSGRQAWSLASEINPFSPTAVARVAEFDDDSVTIETSAVRDAYRFLDGYLSSASADPARTEAPSQGSVMAVLGDYGTGKTHLTVKLMHRAQRHRGPLTHTMYLEAPADTFVALYRRFVDKLTLRDVVDRVEDYYADIVADTLEGSEATAGVARLLRDGEVDPIGIVEDLGLSGSVLLRRLQEKLARVTSNAAFGTALTLLLRAELQDAVWSWLHGNDPDPILVERGITTATDNEELALEALGVFSLLYSGREHRFVLVIDELDKVLLAANRPTPAAVTAFRKLLSVFSGAGALLIIAGLTDVLEVLGEDVKQRIGHVVEMSPLTASEVREFIVESQERIIGQRRLAPFTAETVEYLVNLANGNPRKIIRLCYHVYRRATEQGVPATEEMVREVARTHFDFATIRDVSREVRRILDKEGIPFLRRHLVGSLNDSPVDFWLPLRDANSGCAVLLTESLLSADEVTNLLGRASAISRAVPASDVLVVVVGYIPAQWTAELRHQLGTEPIVYDRMSFGQDFSATVKALVATLTTLHGTDSPDVNRERLERLSRQQSNTQSLIEQLIVHIDGIRSATDRQLGSIQHDVDEIARAVFGVANASGEERAAPSRIPVEVTALFDEALDALAELGVLDALLRDAVSVSPADSAQASNARAAIRARLRREPDALFLVGLADSLQKLVSTFRTRIVEWHSKRSAVLHGSLDPAEEDSLNALCQNYDAAYDLLPLHQLDQLSELADRGPDDSVLMELTQAAHRRNLRQVFDNLGVRVRNAVLQSVRNGAG